MASPNEELQKIEDEYFSQRFDLELTRLFSLQTLCTVLSFVGIFGIYGLAATNAFHFYPSNWGIEVGLGLTGGLALGITTAAALRLSNKAASQGAAKRPDLFGVSFCGVLVAILIAPVTFNICLGLVTELMGTTGQQHAIEKYWRSASRRGSCAGPAIQGVSFDMSIVCVDRHRKNEFPAGSHLTLKGKVSSLGMNVEGAVPHW